MKNRLYQVLAFSIVLYALSYPLGATAAVEQIALSSVNHVVIAWLKEPANKTARQRFIDVTKGFSNLPGVVSVRVGQVLPSERNVVDSSFDAAAVITFEDKAALTRYLNHPVHKRAVDAVLNLLVDRVIVYDFVSD